MKVHDVIQGSDEWHRLRLGKMTASHAHTISVGGKGLDTYCRALAAERFTGQRENGYISQDMATGIEEEDYARMAYEMTTNQEITQIGFIEYSNYLGCSPDGLIGSDGGIELKRKTNKCHNDLILGAVEWEPAYIWQCHANMLITDRLWWDLCSFNPFFKNKSLIITRIERSSEADEKILAGVGKGIILIENYLKKY